MKENSSKYETEMKAYAMETQGLPVEFLHPQAGFVLKGQNSLVYLNLCSENKVSKPKERFPGQWEIPYAVPPSRPHLHEGETVTLFDVLFHPFSLKKAIKNRRFKAALKETAIEAVVRMDNSLSKESFSVLANLAYVGIPHPILLKPQTPKYSIKYRESDPFSQAGSFGKCNNKRPESVIVEVELPEFSGASSINLDVTRSALSLQTQEPVSYHLHVPFSYPVDEDSGFAKFEKNTRRLIVTIPIIPNNKSERLISIDSGIDSDSVADLLPSSPPISEEDMEEELEVDKDAMKPQYRLIQIPQSHEHLRGYRIRFSSMGAGMVRLEEPSVDFWDNNITLDIPVSPIYNEILVGKTIQELTVQSNPSLEILRSSQNKFQHLKKDAMPEGLEKIAPALKERHSSGDSEDSLMEESSFQRERSRFNVTPLDSEEDMTNNLNSLPSLPTHPSTSEDMPSIRGILKRRTRSYSESQADQIRRWEEAAASVSRSANLLKDLVMEKEEDIEDSGSSCKDDSSCSMSHSYNKKSVRFNDHVERQTFRKNASIFSQRQKNLKMEQKKRKNALRQRRASEGDAQKDTSSLTIDNFSDSGVEVFSTAEDTEEDNPSPISNPPSQSTKNKSKKNKRKSKNKEEALSNIFQHSEQLMFELDIE
ncbi:DNAAF2 [Lepeophtheirus salmonis]|uniref:DNAAF2 n=1 Tax=Lepeophtheirus salmonis TaxID=72036 RepID=A0A7R8H9C4_LEPSM|nr:DNAAF2 [Lepeophtheirus salmonis]CAF2954236.1 DNAAF2 [Lepeophtheirus salmonis]